MFELRNWNIEEICVPDDHGIDIPALDSPPTDYFFFLIFNEKKIYFRGEKERWNFSIC